MRCRCRKARFSFDACGKLAAEQRSGGGRRALTTPSPVTLRQRSQVEGGSGGRARAARPAWVGPVHRARMSSKTAEAATRRREKGCMADSVALDVAGVAGRG